MLIEYVAAERKDGHLTRKWFGDSYFDLYCWLDDKGSIHKFQLCYDKSHDEHALTWIRPSTYYHQRVDDGENRPGKSKASPVLIPDGMFDFHTVAERFLRESKQINHEIAQFVHMKLLEFGKR